MAIKYEIEEHVVAIGEDNGKDWRVEVNLISWNGQPAKYDIRKWSPDHEKMGKGITLTKEEFDGLKEALCGTSSVNETSVTGDSVDPLPFV